LIGMGAIGYVGQSFLYLSAIKYASAGLVALLLYLYPIFVAVLAAVFLSEKFSASKIAALLLATLGASLTANPEGGHWLGIFMAIFAALVYSVYIIIGTGVMKQVSAVQSSAVIFASAGVVDGMLMLVSGAHFPQTAAGWGAVGALIVVATVIPVVTFLAGLKRIGPTNSSMLSTLEPVVTVILATLIFGERLNTLMLFGGGLILISVLLLARSEVTAPAPVVNRSEYESS
jgi:drug/metabolite transporter (DMT)-like permease